MGALDEGRRTEFSAWLAETAELVRAAGGVVVGEVVQSRSRPDPALYFGPGKVMELERAVAALHADTLVVAGELSPTQLRNLEVRLGRRVVDRTEVILDIFAARALSREGKLQVELAQLSYRLPRLAGRGAMLSRLGGGIGTRGPGETKLETDRRHILTRMAHLRRELAAVAERRARLSEGRRDVLRGALVGYTNAGKSSLLEALAEGYRGSAPSVFATLDPTVRQVHLFGNLPMVLIDTVGFVRELPEALVRAFRATLEEIRGADFLLHVVDVTSPYRDEEIAAVRKVLADLGVGSYPTVLVYNKADLLPGRWESGVPVDGALVSALHRTGLEGIRAPLLAALGERVVTVAVRLRADEAAEAAYLHRRGEVLAERVMEAETEYVVRLLPADARRLVHDLGGERVVLQGDPTRMPTWEAKV